MQIQISWLLQKPTDLDLHCLQKVLSRVYPGSAGQGLMEQYPNNNLKVDTASILCVNYNSELDYRYNSVKLFLSLF